MYKKEYFANSDQIIIWLNENKNVKVVSILWEENGSNFFWDKYSFVVIYFVEQ